MRMSLGPKGLPEHTGMELEARALGLNVRTQKKRAGKAGMQACACVCAFACACVIAREGPQVKDLK